MTRTGEFLTAVRYQPPKSTLVKTGASFMIVGIGPENRSYTLFGLHREDEQRVDGRTLDHRARQVGAHIDEEHGQYLVDHQNDLPALFRRRYNFAFFDWRHPNHPNSAYNVYTRKRSDGWFLGWYHIDGRWARSTRVVYMEPSIQLPQGVLAQTGVLPMMMGMGPEHRSYLIHDLDQERGSGVVCTDAAKYADEDDGQCIIDHQDQILDLVPRNAIILFLNWRHHSRPNYVYCARWSKSTQRWVKLPFSLEKICAL